MKANNYFHILTAAISLLALLSFTSASFAATGAAHTSTVQKRTTFADVVTEFSEHCQPDCVSPFRVEAQNIHVALFETTLKSKLEKIAFDQSQVWADTILEGDYYADGENVLESVEALYKGDRFLGYRIFYYEKAWDTSTCTFDPETLEGLENCTPGVIREASFVSPSFRSVLTDEYNYATFIPKKR